MNLSPKMAKTLAMAELVRRYPTDFSGQNLPMRVNFMREKDPKQWVAARDRPEAVSPHPHISIRADGSSVVAISVPLTLFPVAILAKYLSIIYFLTVKMWRLAPH
jgi:hypothetical protein